MDFLKLSSTTWLGVVNDTIFTGCFVCYMGFKIKMTCKINWNGNVEWTLLCGFGWVRPQSGLEVQGNLKTNKYVDIQRLSSDYKLPWSRKKNVNVNSIF